MIRRRQGVGWEIACDALGCQATTAKTSPPSTRRSAERATEAAAALGWIRVPLSGAEHWVCPLQQTYDERLERWVAKAHALQHRTKEHA